MNDPAVTERDSDRVGGSVQFGADFIMTASSSSSSSSTPLLAEANYGSVMARGECATRTRVYATRWYILALFSLLGLFQVGKILRKKMMQH